MKQMAMGVILIDEREHWSVCKERAPKEVKIQD